MNRFAFKVTIFQYSLYAINLSINVISLLFYVCVNECCMCVLHAHMCGYGPLRIQNQEK